MQEEFTSNNNNNNNNSNNHNVANGTENFDHNLESICGDDHPVNEEDLARKFLEEIETDWMNELQPIQTPNTSYQQQQLLPNPVPQTSYHSHAAVSTATTLPRSSALVPIPMVALPHPGSFRPHHHVVRERGIVEQQQFMPVVHGGPPVIMMPEVDQKGVDNDDEYRRHGRYIEQMQMQQRQQQYYHQRRNSNKNNDENADGYHHAPPVPVKQGKEEIEDVTSTNQSKRRTKRKLSSGNLSTGSGTSSGSKSTFLELVSKYIIRTESGQLDVSRVFSRECFEEWLALWSPGKSKRIEPEECFRKVLVGHITVSDGKSLPFGAEVEAAILKLLRRKEVWPCFSGHSFISNPAKKINIGIKGVHILGYHERRKLGLPATKRVKRSKKPQQNPTSEPSSPNSQCK